MFSVRLVRTRASTPLARKLHTSRPAAMPLYICYCPDYPNNLETRLANRPGHLEEAAKDKVTGNSGEYPGGNCSELADWHVSPCRLAPTRLVLF
jgi:hypothetical protein